MSMEEARRRLAQAKRPVSFTGAGLSAESGVPTFRDAQSGLWARFSPERLASPQGFDRDPKLVLQWYAERRSAVAKAQPNAAHRALAARPWTHITQNVDDLLQRAGAERVVQLHGSIAHDRCHADCGHIEAVDLHDPPGPRHCPTCAAPLRPAVVWFGEALPAEAWRAAEEACAGSDLLLVVGTSAVVYPAAGLILVAKYAGASVLLINTEQSDASDLADVELLGPAGTILPQLLEGAAGSGA